MPAARQQRRAQPRPGYVEPVGASSVSGTRASACSAHRVTSSRRSRSVAQARGVVDSALRLSRRHAVAPAAKPSSTSRRARCSARRSASSGAMRVRSPSLRSGIAIGVAALVLLGALSEKTSRLVEGGRDFGAGQITVSGAGGDAGTGMTRGALVSGEQLAALRAVPGVAEVAPIVMFPLTRHARPLPFTLAPMAFGVDAELLALNRRSPPPRIRRGRADPAAGQHRGGDRRPGGEAATRPTSARRSRCAVRTSRWSGVLEPTLTGPDSFVMMPSPRRSGCCSTAEPMLRRLAMVPGSRRPPDRDRRRRVLAGRRGSRAAGAAHPRAGPRPVGGVARTGGGPARPGARLPARRHQRRRSGRLLVVASLAVANTMFTAMVERRREIGLWRVVGRHPPPARRPVGAGGSAARGRSAACSASPPARWRRRC